MDRFEATVEERGRGGRVIAVPLDGPALFGRVRAPVRGAVNGDGVPVAPAAADRPTSGAYGNEARDAVRRAAANVG